jgi:hypothetical protein
MYCPSCVVVWKPHFTSRIAVYAPSEESRGDISERVSIRHGDAQTACRKIESTLGRTRLLADGDLNAPPPCAPTLAVRLTWRVGSLNHCCWSRFIISKDSSLRDLQTIGTGALVIIHDRGRIGIGRIKVVARHNTHVMPQLRRPSRPHHACL